MGKFMFNLKKFRYEQLNMNQRELHNLALKAIDGIDDDLFDQENVAQFLREISERFMLKVAGYEWLYKCTKKELEEFDEEKLRLEILRLNHENWKLREELKDYEY